MLKTANLSNCGRRYNCYTATKLDDSLALFWWFCAFGLFGCSRQEQSVPKADVRNTTEVTPGNDPTNRVADSLHDPSGHSTSSRDVHGQASVVSWRSKSTRSGRGQSTSNSTGRVSREPGVYSLSSGRATPASASQRQRDPPPHPASRRSQPSAPTTSQSQPQDIVIFPDDLQYKDLGRDFSSFIKGGGAGQ